MWDVTCLRISQVWAVLMEKLQIYIGVLYVLQSITYHSIESTQSMTE